MVHVLSHGHTATCHALGQFLSCYGLPGSLDSGPSADCPWTPATLSSSFMCRGWESHRASVLGRLDV